MSEISNYDKTNPADADGLNISAGDLRNNFVGVGVMVGQHMRNLVVTNPTAATVDIDADMVLLENTDSPPLQYLARSVNLTATISSSGANGLDTGAEANSTWYFCWIIYNASTDTVASLLSVSSTLATITLPSGYTFGKFVGVARNDGSGDIVDFLQRENRVIAKDFDTADHKIVTNGRSDAAWSAAVSLAAFVPTIAKRVITHVEISPDAAYGACVVQLGADGSGNYREHIVKGEVDASGDAITDTHEQELIDQNLHYWTSEGANTIRVNIFIVGYWITI